MNYTVIVRREDGLENRYMVDEKFIKDSSLIGFNAQRMALEMLEVPEFKPKSFREVVEASLQPKQVFHTSNPAKTELDKMVRHVYSKLRENEIMYGHAFPRIEMEEPETTEDGTTHRAKLTKGVKDNGENPETD